MSATKSTTAKHSFVVRLNAVVFVVARQLINDNNMKSFDSIEKKPKSMAKNEQTEK